MKSKILLCISGAVILSAIIASWVKNIEASKPFEDVPPITLRVTSEKEQYVLGETVRLRFELANESYEPMRLPYQPNVMTGYLKIWIASEKLEFNQYDNSSWGIFEGSGVTILPGKIVSSEASIIWNRRPPTSHLNASAARLATKGRITTDYAFPEAGVYYIKAVASIPDKNSPGSLTKVGSQPIQITVVEPVGDDLKVWNKIKDNGDIAYFLQQGTTPTFEDEKAKKLIDQVEQIVQGHPNSLLASRMKETLEKFYIDEEKRKEMIERSKVKAKN